MHKLFISIGCFFVGILGAIFFSVPVQASTQGPVINRFQAGGGAPSGASQQEFIEIYNNSIQDIQVTNWCLYYNNTAQVICFVPPDTQTQLYITSHGSILVTSSQFLLANQNVTPDFSFSSNFTTNIPGTNGSIKLTDEGGQVVDRLGWGTGTGETTPMAGNLLGGKVFQRKPTLDINQLQDTDNNINDFIVGDPPVILPSGGMYDEYTPNDACPNVDGIQATMPVGYLADSNGNCQKDVCDNLDNLQITIPDGYQSLDGINCTPIPPENATLLITELLPNSASYDTGNEFIEIYNPNDRAISLKGYNLQLGPSFSKNYPLPADQTIAAKTYKTFSDSQTGLVLPNSSGFVRLIAPAGNAVSTTDIYSEPGEDMAWALLNDVWQYTNQPTPSVTNLPSLAGGSGGGSEGTITDLTSCPAGKYRNPETNRCKNIEDSSSSLTPCAADQVRNPATNRCRSIFSTTSSGLTLCSAGQERNPETNRCRKIGLTTASSLKPCVANEERNPATNRCRKKSTSSAAKAVKDIESQTMADRGGWFLAGSASIGLAGYGVAEWRSEIGTGLRRISALLGKNPPNT